MTKIKNIKNLKFGRLLVIEFKEIKNHRAIWLCKCDCGNIIDVSSNSLMSGKTKSCGCLNMDRILERTTKHGFSKSKLYKIWSGIKERCYNKNNKNYNYYGGRNIKMCEEWKNDFMSFYNWSMNNGYKENLTIDRINNDGNYEPSNCRWTTHKQQMRNYRGNHYITFHGETLCLKDMAEKYSIKPRILSYRIKRGWSVEKALTTPLKK